VSIRQRIYQVCSQDPVGVIACQGDAQTEKADEELERSIAAKAKEAIGKVGRPHVFARVELEDVTDAGSPVLSCTEHIV
jgi:hypothetical protein